MSLTRLLDRLRTKAPATDAEPVAPDQVDRTERRHRFLVSTSDFLTGGGEPMKRYSAIMYGPTAHAASLRALNLIETRFAPNVMPEVTSIECDMGCYDRYHN